MREFLWNLAVRYLRPKSTTIEKPEVGDFSFDELKSKGTYVGSAKLSGGSYSADMIGTGLMMSALWSLRHAREQGVHGVVRPGSYRYTVEYVIAIEPTDAEGIQDMSPAGMREFVEACAAAALDDYDDDYEDYGDDSPQDDPTGAPSGDGNLYDFTAAKSRKRIKDDL